jgi:hypothetical protein
VHATHQVRIWERGSGLLDSVGGATPDAPWVPAAITFIIATTFVVLRLERIGAGNISAFVVAGSHSVDAATDPNHLLIGSRAGYDGQFYYRLALAPWDLSRTAFGVTIDVPLRLQRIGYPAIAWLMAIGHRQWVPYSLVAVNVIALSLLGLFSGLWARSLGRHALWGLLPAGYFGLEYSLARDLTEITAACFMVAGIVSIRSSRPMLAAAALSGAVLSRETTLVLVVALLLARVDDAVRRKERPSRVDVAWLVPLLVFGAWQVTVRITTGVFPLSSDRGSNLSLPFVAIVRAVGTWSHQTFRIELIGYVSLLSLGAVVVLAVFSLGRTTALRFEQIAFCLALLMTVLLSSNVWNADPVEFRTFTELWILGCGVILGRSGGRLAVPAILACLAWLLVAAWKVTSI